MSKHFVHNACSIMQDIHDMTFDELEQKYEVEIDDDGSVWDSYEQRIFSDVHTWASYVQAENEADFEETYVDTSPRRFRESDH